jgi:hypothetical protein
LPPLGGISDLPLRRRRLRRRFDGTNKFRNRCQHLAPMAKKDPDVHKVLISQMGENRDIDAVIGKGFRVLGHAELFEPVRNLLHLQLRMNGSRLFLVDDT